MRAIISILLLCKQLQQAVRFFLSIFHNNADVNKISDLANVVLSNLNNYFIVVFE